MQEAGTMVPTGDAPAFEEYVAARGRALWRTAWLLTGDAHRAEDLVQAALVKCWRRWDAIAADGSVEGYMRKVLVTTYTDWWRRRWTGEVPTETLPEVALTSTDLAVRRDVVAARHPDHPRGARPAPREGNALMGRGGQRHTVRPVPLPVPAADRG